MKKPELLAPAGDFSMLAAAIKAGADAVYFGVKGLNMRAKARNFEISELSKIATQCHRSSVKCYLTLNTIIYQNELAKAEKILKAAKKAGVDAVICWDLAVIKLAKKLKIPIHVSTQASISNTESATAYEKLGAKRIVLARECSLEQVREIARTFDVEVFCHGAMCVSQSGRCFISQFTQNCSANRGECLQPCRRRYAIKDVEEGHELELDGEYVMSAKDLCTIEFLDKLIDAGAVSLKIEGRMKSADYVFVVVSVYREAIDLICSGKKVSSAKIASWKQQLGTVFNRGFSSGFFLGKPINEWHREHGPSVSRQYVGKVTKWFSKIKVAEVRIENSNISIGDTIRFIGSKTGVVECVVKSIELAPGKKIKSASKGQLAGIKTSENVREGDKVFKLF